METRLSGSNTIIYIGGGNKWLTRKPLSVHNAVAKQFALQPTETADDYMEIEQTMKDYIDGWTEPSKLFILLWNAACGKWGKYNEQTGFFELNGITDITYAEAIRIYLQGTFDSANIQGKYFSERTNLPITAGCTHGTIAEAFSSDSFQLNLKVANVTPLSSWASFAAYPVNYWHKPFGFAKLVKVIGKIDFHFATTTINWFQGATNLEEVEIWRLANSINLGSCAKLNLASFQGLIAHANSDADSQSHQRVVTVHADVFAKLTDESNVEWHQVYTDAAAKNINFATA